MHLDLYNCTLVFTVYIVPIIISIFWDTYEHVTVIVYILYAELQSPSPDYRNTTFKNGGYCSQASPGTTLKLPLSQSIRSSNKQYAHNIHSIGHEENTMS